MQHNNLTRFQHYYYAVSSNHITWQHIFQLLKDNSTKLREDNTHHVAHWTNWQTDSHCYWDRTGDKHSHRYNRALSDLRSTDNLCLHHNLQLFSGNGRTLMCNVMPKTYLHNYNHVNDVCRKNGHINTTKSHWSVLWSVMYVYYVACLSHQEYSSLKQIIMLNSRKPVTDLLLFYCIFSTFS